MTNFAKSVFGLAALGCIGWSVGCANETPPTTPATSTSTERSSTDMPAPQRPEPDEPATLPTEGNPAAEPGVEGDTTAPGAGDQTMSAEVQAALASLSTEDRELAIKQKICPVSGGPLGSMGAPIKVTVAGHNVFICCEHCEQPLKDEPAKYLAKIGLQPAEESAVQ